MSFTILYADPDIPSVRPMCGASGGGGGGGKGGGKGGCGGVPPCSPTIKNSSILRVDPTTFNPKNIDATNPDSIEGAYKDGMTLTAIQFPSSDPASPCFGVGPGIVPFTLTQSPKCTGPACQTLNLNHNPGAKGGGINLPGGFQGAVNPQCAVIGLFHIVQYRIFPLPPTENPSLERRDLALGGDWTPVAANIENLQIQYSQGLVENFQDVPPLTPNDEQPNTYIMRVRVTVAGRSESTNLQGGTQGVFAAGDTHLRKTFTTTLSLRNQSAHAQQKANDLKIDGWN